MRKVKQIMGMPVSVDIPSCADDGIFGQAFERLNQIDKKFSVYKRASEVSQFAAGKIEYKNLSNELKMIIKECKIAQKNTKGYFSAWAGGKFDPSGYVKGWAISEAGKTIEQNGYGTYCISAGGDILAHSNTEKVWKIGIQDPLDKSKILDLLSIFNGAVATSGNYERGDHIINPKTGKPADDLLSITVIGPDIIKADILIRGCVLNELCRCVRCHRLSTYS